MSLLDGSRRLQPAMEIPSLMTQPKACLPVGRVATTVD
jgi:hypothetical protein